jgi:hypothetical protein
MWNSRDHPLKGNFKTSGQKIRPVRNWTGHSLLTCSIVVRTDIAWCSTCHRNSIPRSVVPPRPAAWAFYDLMARLCVHSPRSCYPRPLDNPHPWRLLMLRAGYDVRDTSVPYKYWTVVTLTGHLSRQCHKVDHRSLCSAVNVTDTPMFVNKLKGGYNEMRALKSSPPTLVV